MSIIDELALPENWHDYYELKCERKSGYGYSRNELDDLSVFIAQRRFIPLAKQIKRGEGFTLPQKRLINKLGSDKKRIVYSFCQDENLALKLMARLLYRYDAVMSPSLYSFRRCMGVKCAIRALNATPDIEKMHCLKLDIKNYFNSVDIELLLPILKSVLEGDAELFAFLQTLLSADAAIEDGLVVRLKRGVMAGTPISPFLANIYLNELDAYFDGLTNAPYARYSDDIIVFAPDKQTLDEYEATIRAMLSAKHLAVNEEKVFRYAPGEAWEFLGVSCFHGEIDLSAATKAKLKGKLNRKARALYRWKIKKNASDEQAMRAYIRAINKKLYDNPVSTETTWARWFFPLITVTDGLKELDAYIRDNIRFVASGRYRKANYRVGHGELQSMGCRSLVNEYYRFKAFINGGDTTNETD